MAKSKAHSCYIIALRDLIIAVCLLVSLLM